MAEKKTKALVLFSGGLDSRLVVKLLQEQGIDVEAVLYQLPFGSGCCNDFFCSFKFSQMEGVKLNVVDCTKGKLFQDYMKIIQKPKYGRGTAMNPCRDCRIFLLKQAKKLAKEIGADFIATGEVLGERPMSQHKQSLMLIEKKAGLKNKVVRPLSAKLLPETEAEKKGLADRNKFLDIQGRYRKRQIELAEKYKIRYPLPGGGCLLCEKDYAKKIIDLFNHKKKILPEDILLLSIGRHFRKNGKIILGKDEKENEKLELLNKKLRYHIIIPTNPGPTVIYEDKKDADVAEEIMKAYSSKDLRLREGFNDIRIK